MTTTEAQVHEVEEEEGGSKAATLGIFFALLRVCFGNTKCNFIALITTSSGGEEAGRRWHRQRRHLYASLHVLPRRTVPTINVYTIHSFPNWIAASSRECYEWFGAQRIPSKRANIYYAPTGTWWGVFSTNLLYRPATTPGVRWDQRCVLCRTTEEANSYSKSCTCPLHLIDMTGRMRSCLCRSFSRPFIQLQELKSFMSGIGIENLRSWYFR